MDVNVVRAPKAGISSPKKTKPLPPSPPPPVSTDLHHGAFMDFFPFFFHLKTYSINHTF